MLLSTITTLQKYKVIDFFTDKTVDCAEDGDYLDTAFNPRSWRRIMLQLLLDESLLWDLEILFYGVVMSHFFPKKKNNNHARKRCKTARVVVG